MAKNLSLEKALSLLRRTDARLVRLHANNGGAGFYVWPSGGRVSDEDAQRLLGRNDVHETDKFEPEYDAQDDFARSLEESYRVIRERVAAGGRPWVPK
jgi:hypothetical protein